jgi:ribosomal protein L37AE/L43A
MTLRRTRYDPSENGLDIWTCSFCVSEWEGTWYADALEDPFFGSLVHAILTVRASTC